MSVVSDADRIERAEELAYVDFDGHIDPADLDELNESLSGQREVEEDDDFEVPF
mgnify:CR=1 FL=1